MMNAEDKADIRETIRVFFYAIDDLMKVNNLMLEVNLCEDINILIKNRKNEINIKGGIIDMSSITRKEVNAIVEKVIKEILKEKGILEKEQIEKTKVKPETTTGKWAIGLLKTTYLEAKPLMEEKVRKIVEESNEELKDYGVQYKMYQMGGKERKRNS